MITFDFNQIPGKSRGTQRLVTDGEPLVSIITPFYNAGQYFMETVNCVLNQSFPYFEWIIVNDGSTNEEDIQLLSEIEQMDPRVSICHKPNGGLSSARNYGIRAAKTDIVIPLDADDLIEPTYCECVYWSLVTNPDASWSYTDCVGFFDQEYLWKKQFTAKQMKVDNLLTCTAGIRKQALVEAGLYTEIEGHFNEDWHLWLKMLEQGKYPVHMGWYGFWYRRRNQGMNEHVKTNEIAKKRSRQLIAQIAKKVDDEIKAIEYPRQQINEHFMRPKKWTWKLGAFTNDAKTRVLMLLPHMEMGGADLFNLDIVSRINKQEFEVSVITTSPAESSWRQRFEKHVSDVFDLTTFLDIENWSAFIHYFIKTRKIDILFVSNSYYGYYLIPWIRKEFPDLVIIDYVHMEEWYWRSGGYARTSGAVGDIIEKTYVCNDHLRNVMISSFGKKPEDVETLYIGVDEKEFDPECFEYGRAKLSLGIGKERPVVLFPCRLHPQKRPFLMVEIAKRLRKKIESVAFVVVGDGPQTEELERVVKEGDLDNTIFFAGRQSDVRPYYRDSTVTLICSLKEGLSLTSYESLSMGVPVISTNVGGQKELINEKVGRILPIYQDDAIDLDNRSFLDKEIDQYVDVLYDIITLPSDEKQNLKKACRDKIVNGYSKRQMINRLENEFRNWKSGMGKEKRNEISKAINLMPHLIDDYSSIFHEYMKKEIEAEELWKSKLYFQEMLNSKERDTANSPVTEIVINDYAVQELQRIYSMRSWKLINSYRNFMDRPSNRYIRYLRDLVFRNKNRTGK